MVELSVSTESWPIRGSFTIARGAKTKADVVVVKLDAGGFIGRGECVPYARYGESCDSVVDQVESLRRDVEQGMDRLEPDRVIEVETGTPGTDRGSLIDATSSPEFGSGGRLTEEIASRWIRQEQNWVATKRRLTRQ